MKCPGRRSLPGPPGHTPESQSLGTRHSFSLAGRWVFPRGLLHSLRFHPAEESTLNRQHRAVCSAAGKPQVNINFPKAPVSGCAGYQRACLLYGIWQERPQGNLPSISVSQHINPRTCWHLDASPLINNVLSFLKGSKNLER